MGDFNDYAKTNTHVLLFLRRRKEKFKFLLVYLAVPVNVTFHYGDLEPLNVFGVCLNVFGACLFLEI